MTKNLQTRIGFNKPLMCFKRVKASAQRRLCRRCRAQQPAQCKSFTAASRCLKHCTIASRALTKITWTRLVSRIRSIFSKPMGCKENLKVGCKGRHIHLGSCKKLWLCEKCLIPIMGLIKEKKSKEKVFVLRILQKSRF